MEKNKFHILVVDDDDKIRSLIRQFLSEKGFIVSSAENAEKAKSKIEIFNFNLIILDVMMPGQSGYELTKELKESKNIPIILLTAKGEAVERIEGLEVGADDYLPKPFEPKELLARIQSILRRVKEQNTLIDIIEFIDVKGWKAIGNKISDYLRMSGFEFYDNPEREIPSSDLVIQDESTNIKEDDNQNDELTLF